MDNAHTAPQQNKFLILKIILFTILFPTEKWLSNVYRGDRYIVTNFFCIFNCPQMNKSIIRGSFSCVDISRARCNRRRKRGVEVIGVPWKRELVVFYCRWCRRSQLGWLSRRPSCPALCLSRVPFHLQKRQIKQSKLEKRHMIWITQLHSQNFRENQTIEIA